MNTILNSALTLTYKQLSTFAGLDNFWQVFDTAFGTQYNRSGAEILRLQWLSGDFGQLPQIEILDSNILGGANGAYASSNNKIYLSANFVATATAEAISAVLLEEIGHLVDAKINQTDSAGDEGAIFSALVQGNSLDDATLLALKAEDDSGIIIIDREAIAVENAVTPSIGLNALLNQTGKIYLSVDGHGTPSSTGSIKVLKNPGATVRTAYLIGDGTSNNSIGTSASVNGKAITWERIESTPWGGGGGNFYSYFSDVTSLVKPTIDAAAAGTLNIAVNEGSESPSYEGLALAVVFDDPNQTDSNSVILYFGGLNPTGGTATINFASPVNTSLNLEATLGLGIGYSYNSGTVARQVSQVKVNGQLLTSVAGNYDDGEGSNGALFTVGGLGDSPNNPPPSSTDITTDDELYNLQPFIKDGDTSITLNTVNPSNDDHIFFAHLTLKGITGIDSRNVVTLAVEPASVNEDGNSKLVYTFTRTGATTNPLTVSYKVGGTAELTTDYTQTGAASFTAITGTITFAAGASTATLTIYPTADTIIESDETVALTLVTETSYALGTTTAVTGTIANDDPTITVAVSPSSVLEDGTTNLVYTFTRTGITTNALTVNYSITGTADSSDYTGATLGTGKTITFAAGASTATLTIDPTADTTTESNETVGLTLVAGTGYTVGTTGAVTGTILDDDATITLAVSPSSVFEDGTTNLVYTFTRTGYTANALTVNYNITGTADSSDYTGATLGTGKTITFAAGASTATLTIDPTADTTTESNETVGLTLVAGTGYTVGTTGAVTGTILDDDATITLAVSPSSVFEDGTTNLVYTFTRTGITTNALTVNYSLTGTADSSDYTGATLGTGKTITFAAGASTATLTIDPTADTTTESNETVGLTLVAGTGYTVGTTGAVTGTILDDDATITLAVSSSSVFEDGTTNLVYTFTRTGITTSALTVNYSITGTANSSDYTGATPGTGKTITFAAGATTATLTIDPTADSTTESNETVGLTLVAGTGYTVETTGAVTGTIANDDPTITLTVDPAIVTEDGTDNLVYTFTRTGITTSALTVNYSITGTADSSDYTGATPGTGKTITFAAGASTATLTIDPTADTIVESNETVALTLAAGTDYTIGTTTAVTGIIRNDHPVISFSSPTFRVNENGDYISAVTIIRTGNVDGVDSVTVTPVNPVTPTNGTATAPGDFNSNPIIVNFANGETSKTIRIPIENDTAVESTETVNLTLSNPSRGAKLGSQQTAVLTIVDNDVSFGYSITDPNLKTLDGIYYGFQSVGVFTLLKSTTDDFEIQARQESWNGNSNVSVNKAIAIKIGGNRFQLDLSANPLKIDGIATNLPNGQYQQKGTNNIVRSNNTYTIISENGDQIQVALNGSSHINVFAYPASNRQGNLVGLLGNYNGNSNDDFALRNGTVIGGTVDYNRIYGDYGNSWSVTGADSLFIEPNTTAPTFPTTVITINTLTPQQRAEAETSARDAGITDPTLLNAAILDIHVTNGDNTFIQGHTNLQQQLNNNIIGGAGDNSYYVNNAADIIIENPNEGTDSVFSTVTYTLSANVENLTLQGTTAINGTGNELNNNITGNTAANVLTGGDGNDTLNGGAGADTMIGGAGDDSYYVDNTADIITENPNEGTDSVFSIIDYTLGDNLKNLTLTETTAINGTGNELNNIIRGNTAANVLTGGDGNDTLDGGTGADTMIGGAGDDSYYVDNTADIITENPNEGTDSVFSIIDYTLGDNLKNLTLTETTAINGTGNELNNIIRGNTAANVLTGGNGNDTLNGGAGADTMIGGVGDDSYYVDNKADIVTENPNEGTDSVFSTVTYTLRANVENLTLQGTTAINGTGNALNNSIIGNAAANVLTGGAGADTMIGGLGNDSYYVDSAADSITENQNEGTDKVSSIIDYTLGDNLENLTLRGTTAINGTGNELNNSITGNAADNVLIGGLGNDTLNGGAGADTMIGGVGNDSYNVENTADTITENLNEGTDSVSSIIDYTLGDNLENLTLRGTTAINGTGNELNNSITGNAADNVLTGDLGNDTLNGGASADTMIGGVGNDSYNVDNTADIITENLNEGTDRVSSTINYTLGDNLENLTLQGTTAINGTGNELNNSIIGNAADNVLTGNLGNDTLNGGAGADTMIGGVGNDSYNVDNTADIITENLNEGTDRVSSTVTYTLGDNLENLTLTGTTATNGTGNEMNNSITGNAAANVLTGGLGNDTLFGGAGADTMIGGLGTDRLYLGLNDNAVDNVNYVLGDGTDTFYQFVRGVGGDQLNFSGIANFDVITSGTSTLVRVGDGIGGNAGFGTGQLLVTLSGTSGFNSTNFGDNLFGGTFLFS